MKFIARVAFFLSLIAANSQISRAETPDSIPDPQKARRSWVADAANVIDAATEQKIDAHINALEKSNGAEIAVVTVNTLDGKSERDFAFDLFNRWGVGKSGRDNGVLILVAIADRKARIEVGYGLEPVLTDARTGDLYRSVLVPALRAQNYGAGLLNLTSELAGIIESEDGNGTPKQPDSGSFGVKGDSTRSSNTRTDSPPAPNYVPNPFPNNAPQPSTRATPGRSSGSDAAYLLFFAIGGAGIVGATVWFVKRPKKCRKCGLDMVQVPAELEAPHLNDAQEFEQNIGSRDWVVWRCEKCELHELSKHEKWFSGIEDCSFCGNKTARRNSRILTQPTRYSEGLEEITHSCTYPKCHKSRKERRTIPRIPPPSSSSSGGWSSGSSSGGSSSSGGGSFGGGRSGGGGAGGGW